MSEPNLPLFSDEIRKLEKAAYSRGYAAGSKTKSKRELDTIKAKEKAEFRRQVYIQTLAALVSGKQAWTVGDKKCTNAKDFAEVANNIAVQSLPYF